MDSIFKTRTVHAVSYSDLEEFISKHYPQAIVIPDALESGNDTDHEIYARAPHHFVVERSQAGAPYEECFDPGWDKYEQEDFDKWLTTGEYGYSTLDLILSDLVKREIIEEGSYLINISW